MNSGAALKLTPQRLTPHVEARPSAVRSARGAAARCRTRYRTRAAVWHVPSTRTVSGACFRHDRRAACRWLGRRRLGIGAGPSDPRHIGDVPRPADRPPRHNPHVTQRKNRRSVSPSTQRVRASSGTARTFVGARRGHIAPTNLTERSAVGLIDDCEHRSPIARPESHARDGRGRFARSLVSPQPL